MALSKEYKSLMKELNKALDEWEKLNVKPNEVRQAEHMLELFYDWSGKKPKDTARFNTRLKLTEEQQDELEQIAQSFVDMEIFASDYYDEPFMKAFEKVKGRYGINTIDEYRDYVDAKDRYRSEKIVTSVIGWYKYDKLKQRYSKSFNEQVSEEDLNELLTNVYLATGKEKEDLYEFIYKNIPKHKDLKKYAEKFKKQITGK